MRVLLYPLLTFSVVITTLAEHRIARSADHGLSANERKSTTAYEYK